MKKKLIAKLLVLAMVLAMVPATFIAANAAAGSRAGSGGGSSGDTPAPSDTTVAQPAPEITTTVEEIPADGAIEVEVVNDTANVVLSEEAVESLSDLVVSGEIVLELNDEGATRLNVTLPAAALTAVAEETGADLTIKSTVATISIPNSVLTSELGTTGTVKISVQSTGNSVSFSIQVAGQALNGVKGIKVEF